MGLREATFVLLILAAGCRPARPGETGQVVPELTMDGVQFQVDRAGVTTATGPVRITAPAGSGRLGDRHFRVSGGILAIRGSDVAATPSAVSRPGPDGRIRIHGDEAVRLDGRGYRLAGVGFDIDPATGELVLRGRPHLVTGLGTRP